MRLQLPPGIIYLSQRLHYLLLPPLLVCYILSVQLDLPRYAMWVAGFLSLPLTFALGVLSNDLKNFMDARANGGELPPRVRDGWPGGISLVKKLLHNFNYGYPGEIFAEFAEEYGHTFNLRTFHENRIFTTEPEHIKAILATQFDSFEKGREFNFQFYSLLGSGVFNADGEMWKYHRTMARPFFTREKISHFDIFDSRAEDIVARMKERSKEGFPIDMQDAAYRFTMDTATTFLFGKDVCSIAAGLPYPRNTPEYQAKLKYKHPSNEYSEAFAEAQRLVGMRSRVGKNWPLKEFWRDNARPYTDKIKAFIDPIIEEGIRKKVIKDAKPRAPETGENEESETFLEHVLSSTQDRTILRDQIQNIMIAGRDTTAHTITFAMYMLTEHPKMLNRLREEIKHVVGDARPTYDNLRQMKYLRAILNETMRLYPAVAFNVRTTNRPVIWPSVAGGKPLYIPAHTRTQYSVFWMHRRTDLWGSDAFHFDPDRFIDSRKKLLIHNPWMFLPFNGGPRICLGQQFAYNEASFFLTRLVQNFSEFKLNLSAQPSDTLPPEDWKTNHRAGGGREKIWPATNLTMYAKGGVWIDMQENKS